MEYNETWRKNCYQKWSWWEECLRHYVWTHCSKYQRGTKILDQQIKESYFFFSFRLGVQEAHMLSSNALCIESMSSAAASILMNRKIIWGTGSKRRKEYDHKLVFNFSISVQILNFLLAFLTNNDRIKLAVFDISCHTSAAITNCRIMCLLKVLKGSKWVQLSWQKRLLKSDPWGCSSYCLLFSTMFHI